MVIPKKKRLIGHSSKYDIYETPKGSLYAYKGSKKGHYKKQKYWEEL